MLKQGAHIIPNYLTDDGVHVSSGLTQPKVEISKPENLVKSGGDICCRQKFQNIYYIKSMWYKYEFNILHEQCISQRGLRL